MSTLYKTELREDGWAILTADDRLVKDKIPFRTTAEILILTLETDAGDFADRY